MQPVYIYFVSSDKDIFEKMDDFGFQAAVGDKLDKLLC